MGELIGARYGARDTPGAGEVLAGIVRGLMAECRARLAAEDAARDLAGDGQAVAEGAAGRPTAE